MNFRPTLKKVVMSIVIAVIVCMLTYVPKIYHAGEIPIVAYFTNPLALTVYSFILVYVIWSLFQKKKQSDKKK